MAEAQKYIPDTPDEDDEIDTTPSFDPRLEQEAERIAEALVFASAQPVSEAYIESRLPRGADVRRIMGA